MPPRPPDPQKARQREDLPADAVQALEAHLEAKGLKMTTQRLDLLRAALAQAKHFTADELHASLRGGEHAVSLATVYRSLAVLEEAGILEGHDFDGGQRRYERRLAREHHDHMVCLDCRAVVEFENDAIERLQEKVATTHGFRIREHHLTLFVSCDEMAAKGRCPRRDEKLGVGARR
jgi:Fur family ferric uptake transcriptional regulator